MAVYQMMPTITFGDGVSNDALAMDVILRKMGIKTGIYAQNIGERLPANTVKNVSHFPNVLKDDVIIYHFSTGTELNTKVTEYDCKKIMVYHNITPGEFLLPYNADAANLCNSGRNDLKAVKDGFDHCIGDSEYNCLELKQIGFKCDMDVLPIIIPFADYDKKPDDRILKKYGDGKVNLLFTGRIAPNKCQEDVIGSFYFYHKYINQESRLILNGSYEGMEKYYDRLKRYASALGIENDVIFTGKTSFAEVLGFYRVADAFICMSEHEGFCIPLLEAMHFNVPVIAYDSSAVGETLGGGGVLLEEKDPQVTAEWIDMILNNEDLKTKLLKKQKERLEYFSEDKTERKFQVLIRGFVG